VLNWEPDTRLNVVVVVVVVVVLVVVELVVVVVVLVVVVVVVVVVVITEVLKCDPVMKLVTRYVANAVKIIDTLTSRDQI
jgi:hypothetical protein